MSDHLSDNSAGGGSRVESSNDRWCKSPVQDSFHNTRGTQPASINGSVVDPFSGSISGLPVSNPRSRPPASKPLFSTILTKSTTPSTKTSSPQLSRNELMKQARTFIVRRAPIEILIPEVVASVSDQFRIAPRDLFESVLRDPKDRRRLYLTFLTSDLKRTVIERGFYIRDLHIKPSDGSISGYIPFPPYYVELNTLTNLLSRYGTVLDASFVSTDDGVRIAGLRFKLLLKPDTAPPRELKHGPSVMTVRYSDDLRICSFCKNYGHTIGHCRKRQSSIQPSKSPSTGGPVVSAPCVIPQQPQQQEQEQQHLQQPGKE